MLQLIYLQHILNAVYFYDTLWLSHDFYENFICFGPQKEEEAKLSASILVARST